MVTVPVNRTMGQDVVDPLGTGGKIAAITNRHSSYNTKNRHSSYNTTNRHSSYNWSLEPCFYR